MILEVGRQTNHAEWMKQFGRMFDEHNEAMTCK